MPQIAKEIIVAAIAGFEAQKQQLNEQIAELRGMLAGTPATDSHGPVKKRRKLSSAAIQRIREGQKRRWAAARGDSGAAPVKTSKPKRKLSEAGRKAIVAALKKRWAAKRATA